MGVPDVKRVAWEKMNPKYVLVEERDVKKFSAGKGLILALIFLPLVLFAGSPKVECVYEKQ